jgi:hypothetical protein
MGIDAASILFALCLVACIVDFPFLLFIVYLFISSFGFSQCECQTEVFGSMQSCGLFTVLNVMILQPQCYASLDCT